MKRILVLASCWLASFVAFGQAAAPPVFAWAQARPLKSGLAFPSPVGIAHVAIRPGGTLQVAALDSAIELWSTITVGTWRLEQLRADGSVIRQQSIGGKSHLTQLRIGDNGDTYLLGAFLDELILDPQHQLTSTDPNPHAFLACLDSAGAVRYVRDLTSLGTRPFDQPQAIAVVGTNAYIGFRSSSGPTVVKRLSASGADSTVVTQVNVSSINDLTISPTGELLVTGSCVTPGATYNGVPFAPPTTLYSQYLAAYSPGGGVSVMYLRDVTCPESQVRWVRGGDAYWTGELIDSVTIGPYSLPGAATGGTPDFFVTRLDPHHGRAGVRWAYDVPTSQIAGAWLGNFHSFDTDTAGNMYFVGTSFGTMTWAPGLQTTAPRSGSLLVQRRSPAGVVEWVRSVGTSAGTMTGHTLCVAPDGSVYVTGMTGGAATFDQTTLPAAPVRQFYYFIARLQGPAPLGTARSAPPAASWQVAPNPATREVRVTASLPAAPFRAQLFDLLGRPLTAEQPATGAARVELHGVAPGTYLLRLTDEATGQTTTRRIVRE